MYQKLLEVDMDAVLFSTSEDTTLITHGVSTCIAFVIHGSFWDEDEEDEETQFCGLYHWPGFNTYPADPNEQASKALVFFLDRLRTFSGVEETQINIYSLQFIGGEQEQRDDNDEIIVSGTQNEVESLIRIVSTFKFLDYGFNIDHKDIKHHHFLTKDEQTISISLTIHSCNVEIKNPSAAEPSNYFSAISP